MNQRATLQHHKEALGKKQSVSSTIKKKIKPLPIRTAIAALGLFCIGSILIYTGYQIGLDPERRGLSLFLLGLLTFIPGSYATVQLYGTYSGWKGYAYHQIPSYDE